MFKVIAFCDDKKLGDVFKSLAGKVHGQPDAIPVINAQLTNGKVEAASNGELVSLFMQWADSQKLTSVHASDARAFLASIGKPNSTAYYLLKRCQDYKVLRKTGAGHSTRYVRLTPERPRSKKRGK